jgi:hypothetical protein
MDAKELLETLSRCDQLPLEEVAWAEAHREQLVPVFQAYLRRYLDEPAKNETPTPLLLVMSFLGSWRVSEAYRPMIEVLRSDPERLVWQLGDEGIALMPRLVRNVFDGDPQPIIDLVEDEAADEFLRGEMLLVLASLVRDGALDRAKVDDYLQGAFPRLRPQAPNAIWFGWTSAVASLGLSHLAPMAEQAFDRRFVDARMFRRFDFRDVLKRALRNPQDRKVWERREIEPFGSVAEELADWDFAPLTDEELERVAAGLPLDGDGQWLDDEDIDNADLPPVETFVNPLRSVGRNDPCPCGSGKKYKKCCLPKHEQGG